MAFLLDTHILIWWLNGIGESKLKPRQRKALGLVSPKNPVMVADISLWEIAVLVEKKKINFKLPLREWLERASTPPLVQVSSITAAIATKTAELPTSFHRDPADRILVATAIVNGWTLITSDQSIINAKLVPTL